MKQILKRRILKRVGRIIFILVLNFLILGLSLTNNLMNLPCRQAGLFPISPAQASITSLSPLATFTGESSWFGSSVSSG